MYDLDRDGFTFLKGVIPKRLIEGLHKYFVDLSPTLEIGEFAARDPKGFYRFCKALPDTPAGREIGLLPAIRELVPIELPYIADCAVFLNAPGQERLQYDWHSEADYFVNGDAVTLWFPWLHPVNESNGTMVMARGSHKHEIHGFREAVPDGLTQMRILDSALTEFEKVPVNLDLGDACLFLRKTVHRTGNNTSGRPRVSMVIRYTDWMGKFNDGWQSAVAA